MMIKKNLTDRVKQYVTYLEEEIEQHTLVREEYADVLRYARDKLYKIFSEIKPVGYKTVAQLDKRKKQIVAEERQKISRF